MTKIMSKTKKSKAGFTLMEAVIALAIWMLLFTSVFVIWHHASQRKEGLLARQSDFENVRGAMDILLVNMQMAKSIRLYVDRPGSGDILRRMYLPGYCSRYGRPHDFVITFNPNLHHTAAMFQRIGAGGQEMASNIEVVRIRPVAGQYMHVTLETSCEHRFVLEGSVDIRYRQVFLNGILQ